MSKMQSESEYRDRVETIADEIEESLEDDPAAEVSELVFDMVDSSRMVFVHYNALKVLEFSQNGPEEWKHLVSDGDSWRDVVQAMAFDALRNDVWSELRDRDIE